jgi:amidase
VLLRLSQYLVSVPWHPTDVPIWSAIALEGTFHVMVKSPLLHLEGVYPIALAGRLGSRRDRATELPGTVKVGMLLGVHTDKFYQGYFDFKAQNLRRRLCAAHDAALAKYVLLQMPTTRMMMSPTRPPDAGGN